MDTDAKSAAFSGCRHAGCYPLDEVASGLGQPDATRVALENEDAKVFFQRLDAGLRNAERVGGVAEVQILGDGKGLDQRREGMREPSAVGIPH